MGPVDVMRKNNEGMTAYEIATQKCNSEICDLLTEYMIFHPDNDILTSVPDAQHDDIIYEIGMNDALSTAYINQNLSSNVDSTKGYMSSTLSMSPRMDTMTLAPLSNTPAHSSTLSSSDSFISKKSEDYLILGPTTIQEKEQSSQLRKLLERESKLREMAELKVNHPPHKLTLLIRMPSGCAINVYFVRIRYVLIWWFGSKCTPHQQSLKFLGESPRHDMTRCGVK